MSLEILPDGLGGRCVIEAPPSLAAYRRAERWALVAAVCSFPVVLGAVGLGFAAFVEWMPSPAQRTAAHDVAHALVPTMVAGAVAFVLPGLLGRGPLRPRPRHHTLRWDARSLHVSGPRPAALDLSGLHVEVDQGLALADGRTRWSLPDVVLTPADQQHLASALARARAAAQTRFAAAVAPQLLQQLRARRPA